VLGSPGGYPPENDPVSPTLGSLWKTSSTQKNAFSGDDTPWKINMEPENDGLVQMIFPFQLGGF